MAVSTRLGAESRERLVGGEIGRIEQVVITSRDPAPPPAGFVATSGGLFRDMTIHDFDMARSLVGDIAEVYGAGANLIDPAIAAKAQEAQAGALRLFFMPYLVGERFDEHRNARAQFFGITAEHGLAHLHRAVLEGVAFGATRHLHLMEDISGRKVERVVASSCGAKSELWLKIKASAYHIPILLPAEPECGVIGAAALAATAEGRFSRVEDAASAFVRYEREILPDPAWAETYVRMQPFFEKLYRHSQALYDDLDRL